MICEWTHTSTGGGGMVYPDGCRDVVVRRPPNGPAEVMFSSFDMVPRYVSSDVGTVFEGYRLPPGAGLSAVMRDHLTNANTGRIGDLIDEFMVFPSSISDAIEALAQPGVTVAQAGQHVGLSVRRMQRMFRASGQPSPAVWQQLARARQAVLRIADTPLADVAADHGYSDQAHLTRSMRRWFGVTPGALRSDPALMMRLTQPGLGTGMGEPSSIR